MVGNRGRTLSLTTICIGHRFALHCFLHLPDLGTLPRTCAWYRRDAVLVADSSLSAVRASAGQRSGPYRRCGCTKLAFCLVCNSRLSGASDCQSYVGRPACHLLPATDDPSF